MIERFFVVLLLFPGIFGWGKEGHYAICKIAQVKFLSSIFFLRNSGIDFFIAQVKNVLHTSGIPF